MLRKHKNALVRRILASGLDPVLFESGEHDDESPHPAFDVRLKNSPMVFQARNPRGDFNRFVYFTTCFGAGFPRSEVSPDGGYIDLEQVLEAFSTWLKIDVRPYLDDLSIPDLWSQAQASGTLLSHITFGDLSAFTSEEKAQVRTNILHFGLLIEKTFSPTNEEMAAIGIQLEYLASAVDRLNRFDWKGTALNTVLSIGVTLSLDTERGRQLFGLFQQAFAFVMQLLR